MEYPDALLLAAKRGGGGLAAYGSSWDLPITSQLKMKQKYLGSVVRILGKTGLEVAYAGLQFPNRVRDRHQIFAINPWRYEFMLLPTDDEASVVERMRENEADYVALHAPHLCGELRLRWLGKGWSAYQKGDEIWFVLVLFGLVEEPVLNNKL